MADLDSLAVAPQVVVAGFRAGTSQEQLYGEMAQFGPIRDVQLFSGDKYGFVVYEDADSASRAVSEAPAL